MPAASATQKVNAILGALQASGSEGVLLSGVRVHPRQFRVRTPDDEVTIWVYLWTVTPGGRDNLPDEYRIQMTAVEPPLQMNPNGPTLLLGWYPDLEIFAGFDINRHQNFTPGSPSAQISIDALRSASNFGWGFYRNQFGEISAAFRPTEFMNYVRTQEAIHRSGAHAVNLLTRAARLEPIDVADLAPLPAPRRKIVQTITRLARAANFTDQVLSAYNNRCAVTGAQLKLVDAAHILPVVAPNSVDHVTNGICLSPTYHRAFDSGLIYLSSNYHMRLNQQLINTLRGLNFVGGLNQFRHYLDREVFLPANPAQRPSVAYIRRANAFRKIPNP